MLESLKKDVCEIAKKPACANIRPGTFQLVILKQAMLSSHRQV